MRDRRHVATCLEFGPRFLHSTGQAYKGGPDSGVFLQITSDDAQDLPIPGSRASFGVVKAAQARGDFGVLVERGRRALRVHLDGDLIPASPRSRRWSSARLQLSGANSMQIGIIGLGRMGGNIAPPPDAATATRWWSTTSDAKAIAALEQGRRDRRRRPRQARGATARAARGLGDAAGRQDHRATPSNSSASCWQAGDVVIDGGNTFYKDDIRRAPSCSRSSGIHYVDVGTSGGVWGLERGYCMMIGGAEGDRRPARSDLQGAGAGPRRYAAHARTATAAIRAPSRATSMPARTAPGISSR